MRPVFLILLMGIQTAFCQYTLRGKVIDRTLKTPIKQATVWLYLEDYVHADTSKWIDGYGKVHIEIDSKMVKEDSLITDASGRFAFTVRKNKEYAVGCRVRYPPYGDFKRNMRITSKTIKDIVLQLPVYCEFDRYKNMDSCPVCRYKDECIPVGYGLPVPGKTEEELIELLDECKWKEFPGGCMYNKYCHARWYCRRCQKLF